MNHIIVTLAIGLCLAATLAPAQGAVVGEAVAHRRHPHCARDQFRVLLDVGHSAEAPGAISARSVPEYVYNLLLGRKIERQLIDAGFKPTLLIASGPARPSLFARVKRANAAKAHLLISIHHDSVPEMFMQVWEFGGMEMRFSDRFKGHSLFVSFENPHRGESLRFAKRLGHQLKKRGMEYTPHYAEPFMGRWSRKLLDADNGVYRYDELIVLRMARMPAILLEAGSIIHRDEELMARSPERQAAIGAAVADAVEEACAARSSRKPGRRSPTVRNSATQR